MNCSAHYASTDWIGSIKFYNMAHISIIWDQSSVRVWKTKRSSAHFLEEFIADDVASLLSQLYTLVAALKITHLRFYVDLPELDHHIERVPKIAPKLRKQLLEQRKIKMYGDEARVLVFKEMDLEVEAAQSFYLISSLPENISSLITDWALINGILLEGIYSLPQSIAYLGGVLGESAEAYIQFQAIGKAGYLIARDAMGEVLFFSRMDSPNPDQEKIDHGARRLILFVEQEFSLTPKMRIADLADLDDGALVASLSRQKKQLMLNLIRPQEKRRHILQRLRHRAFALLSISLILVLYFTLPLVEKKKMLDLKISEIDTKIQYEKNVLKDLESELQVSSSYIDVIKFCEGRETISESAFAPSPLLVMLLSLSNSLPKLVELDSYEGFINPSKMLATFNMIGRPLTADVDLRTEIEDMYADLQRKGWIIGERKISFEEESSGSRFSQKRGDLRKFILSFSITANDKKNK